MRQYNPKPYTRPALQFDTIVASIPAVISRPGAEVDFKQRLTAVSALETTATNSHTKEGYQQAASHGEKVPLKIVLMSLIKSSPLSGC